jgi:hypothetical protein
MVPFWRFFYKNQAVCAIVFLLSATNCSLFTVISSRLLGLAAFSAPVDAMTESRLSARGIVSNLLEDLPQLVVQIVIASRQETISILVLTSILTSGITLVFGLSKRLLVYEMTKAAVKQKEVTASGASMSRADLVRQSIFSVFSPQGKSLAKSDDGAKPAEITEGDVDVENGLEDSNAAEGTTDPGVELARLHALLKAEKVARKAQDIELAKFKVAANDIDSDVGSQRTETRSSDDSIVEGSPVDSSEAANDEPF